MSFIDNAWTCTKLSTETGPTSDVCVRDSRSPPGDLSSIPPSRGRRRRRRVGYRGRLLMDLTCAWRDQRYTIVDLIWVGTLCGLVTWIVTTLQCLCVRTTVPMKLNAAS